MRLKNLASEKSAWFVFTAGSESARFEIGLLTPGEERDIDSQTQRVHWDEQGRELTYDYNRKFFLVAMRGLLNWDPDDVLDQHDKPMPVTDANRDVLLNTVPGFEAWVRECMAKLTTEVAKAVEADEKNS